jgi:hypothetical protein
MDRDGAQAAGLREIGHEIGMAARDAEADGFAAAALGELFERVLGAGLGGDCFGQGSIVEPPAAPGDLRILDRIRHTEIVKRRQEFPINSRPEIAFIDEVFLAKTKQITAIAAIRGGRQAEEKARLEMINDASIGGGGSQRRERLQDCLKGAAAPRR